MATNIIQRTNNAPVNDNTKHNKMMRSMYGVFNYATIIFSEFEMLSRAMIMPTLSQCQPANCKCTNRFSRILYIQLRKKAFVTVLEGLSLLCNLCARMNVCESFVRSFVRKFRLFITSSYSDAIFVSRYGLATCVPAHHFPRG